MFQQSRGKPRSLNPESLSPSPEPRTPSPEPRVPLSYAPAPDAAAPMGDGGDPMDWSVNALANKQPLTDTERQYLIKHNGCFKCRKLGHKSFQCPGRSRKE